MKTSHLKFTTGQIVQRTNGVHKNLKATVINPNKIVNYTERRKKSGKEYNVCTGFVTIQFEDSPYYYLYPQEVLKSYE